MTQTTERVDTWEMAVIHRVFRREFGRMAGLIHAVPNGDRAKAAIVAEWISDLSTALGWRDMVGRGSGEAFQLELSGSGAVYVQASEEKL